MPRRKRQLLMQAQLHLYKLIYISTGSKSRCLMSFLSGSSKTGLLHKGRWAGVEVTAGQCPRRPGMLSHSAQARGAEHISNLDQIQTAVLLTGRVHSDKAEGWVSKARVRSAKHKATSLLFCQWSARLHLNLQCKVCFTYVGQLLLLLVLVLPKSQGGRPLGTSIFF